MPADGEKPTAPSLDASTDTNGVGDDVIDTDKAAAAALDDGEGVDAESLPRKVCGRPPSIFTLSPNLR